MGPLARRTKGPGMAIEWNPSRGATLGVEWEVQLIDSETKMLRQEAGKLLDELPVASDTGEHPRIRHELMQSTLELVTGICSTVSEAKDDLALTITELQRMATEHGILLACAGTHPLSDWRDATMAPIQRYAELVEQMQWLARRIQTFGLHVHVGIRGRAQGDAYRQCPGRLPSAFSRHYRVEPVLVRV